MKTTIETGIKTLAAKIPSVVTSIEALQYTQAVLNMAHALDIVNFQASRPAPTEPFVPNKPVIAPPRPTPGMEIG